MPGYFMAQHRCQASDRSSVSLGRRFAHRLLRALLQQCVWATVVTLLGTAATAEGTGRVRICRCSRYTSGCMLHLPEFKEVILTLVFLKDSSFWTDRSPWGSLAPLWNSSGTSGLGRGLFSMENIELELLRSFWPWTWLVLHAKQLDVQARYHVTSCEGGIAPGDLRQSTVLC